MGGMLSKNQFEVAGRTVVVTGGSKGMGLQVARQLAEKGASVMIVARTKGVLEEALDFVSQGARNPDRQRFIQVSADLTNVDDCQRIIREATAWNGNKPPDIVWCTAGSSHPTLFVDTPPEILRQQMEGNYLSCAYTAQAILKAWLPYQNSESDEESHQRAPTGPRPPPRHLIFTGSFLTFYPVAGYSPYSPSKAAVRSLSDTLSQETKLYAGAYPNEPLIKIHSVYPAGIRSQSFEIENKIKSDMTKMLEDGDVPLEPAEVAKRAIGALERGEETITTDLMTRLVMTSVLGASSRGGFWKGLLDTLIAWFMVLIMLIVRLDMDSKVVKWGKTNGPTGMKKMKTI